MIEIKIMLDNMPPAPAAPKKDIMAKVKCLIEDMENTKTSKISWKKLKALWEKLNSGASHPKREQLLKLLKPVIVRYAQYDNDGVEINAEDLGE
jgi:hypothetical protein